MNEENQNPYDEENPDSQQSSQNANNLLQKAQEFNELKTKIAQDLQGDIQTQVQTQIQAANQPFGSNTGYVVVGALAVSVISILLLIVIKSALQSQMNKLTSHSKSQKEEIEKLTDELKAAKNEIRTLKSRLENFEVKPNYETPAPVYSAPPPERVQTPAPVYSEKESFQDFVNECNSLASIRGPEQRKRREEIFAKYQVKGFNCKNFNERMNNPNLEPEFETSQSPANCEYWAYEVSSDKFAVVPNVKNYNGNYHGARAMGYVFNSNFRDGNYASVRVVKPAIFSGMWRLDEKGELVLN